jgi:hypothetical protein
MHASGTGRPGVQPAVGAAEQAHVVDDGRFAWGLSTPLGSRTRIPKETRRVAELLRVMLTGTDRFHCYWAVQLDDLVTIDRKIKTLIKELKTMVIATGSKLMDLPGIGPIGAARTLADVGDVTRFADRNRFASWTGTAPLDASSGEQIRHRLSRAGTARSTTCCTCAQTADSHLMFQGLEESSIRLFDLVLDAVHNNCPVDLDR